MNPGSNCDICTDNLFGGRNSVDPTLVGSNNRFADWEVVCLSLDWFNDNVKLCNGTYEGNFESFLNQIKLFLMRFSKSAVHIKLNYIQSM